MNRVCRPAALPRRALTAALFAVLACASGSAAAQAVTSAFTYQGELRTGGNPANANFDMEFRLFNAATGGTQIGPVVTRTNVPAVNGLFNVQLDFGASQFAGDRQWLEVRIKPAGSGSYETLSPRTEVTATPYALGAVAALPNSVTTTSIVDGTIGTADIDSTQIQRRVTGSCPTGQYVRVVAQDGTVTCGTDATGSGTVTSIATGAGLAGGPITTSGTISVAPGGIGATQIDDTQVQRRVTGTCTGTNYVQQVNADGTVGCGAGPVFSGWGLTGNAGTDSVTNFIGTTDAQAFVVRTQNVQSLRIEPSAELFGGNPITANVIAGSSANSVTAGVRGATIAGGGVPTGDSDPNFGLEGPNRVTDAYGTVGGGYANRAGDDAGATTNRAFATVGGGVQNTASGQSSTVSGGAGNTASGGQSTVGGGDRNTASGDFSAVGGGELNAASSFYGTVAGGSENTAGGLGYSTVSGGYQNTASGYGSNVDGGFRNSASGSYSAVGGGERNIASSNSSTVTGGAENCAGGNFSWAGGRRAKVRPGLNPGGSAACSGLTYPGGAGDAGTFVWADSQDASFVSTGSNQFLVRAQGGAAINSNDPAGNALRVAGTLRVDTLGAAAATTLCRNANNQISSCSSSARYKEDIADLELGLATALRLHAVGYRWKDGGEADIGFVAEEIAAIDARLVTRNENGEVEGVKYERLTAVLANAVQELAARESLQAEAIARVQADNASLRAESAELRTRLERLEALVAGRSHENR